MDHARPAPRRDGRAAPRRANDRAERDPPHRRERAARLCGRRRRGGRRRGSRGRAHRNRRRELMAVAQAAGALAAPAPRPWWRGRIGAILALTLGIVIAFFGWKNQLPWPGTLTWNTLARHL